MPRQPAAHLPRKVHRPFHRIILALLNLGGALCAVWLGMSIPSYFRSVSPLVLQAAAEGTSDIPQAISRLLEAGRPGNAQPLLQTLEEVSPEKIDPAWREQMKALYEGAPAYRWSGGPAPFYEAFLKQAAFLRPDATGVIASLLPAAHRERLRGFLEQSPNQLVQRILATDQLAGWQRFYPVQSTSGQPLEATLLCAALLEQASAINGPLRDDLRRALDAADAAAPSIESLENFYLGILTIGTRANWLQLKSLVQKINSEKELLQITQLAQQDPNNLARLTALLELVPNSKELCDYLRQHAEPGWESLRTTIPLGQGATEALLAYDKSVYIPPKLWTHLPETLQNGQEVFKHFAESLPGFALGLRATAFFMCGFFLVYIIRCLFVRPAQGDHQRRLLLNLDTSIGGVIVMLLVWMAIEPSLLNFRPNEEGTLQIRLAQLGPELPNVDTPSAPDTMIDQVTLLILLLFFVIQLLVFVFGLIKIGEVRRRDVAPDVKLRLLDNEENLFDLGLYVGLGGTVSSLILVVLNIVDASLMAAYASTLFGIIFVALLKVGFLRPYRRSLILANV